MPGNELPSGSFARASATWLLLCRIAVLAAILGSAALYVHYLDPADSGLCGLHSGCERVRQSALSYFHSRFLSMPLVGLLAYTGVFALSIALPAGGALPTVAAAGGVAAVVLLSAQSFYVGAFCWLCTLVDGAGVVAAAAAILHRRSIRRSAEPPVDPLARWGWWSLYAIVLVAPLLWTAVKPAPPVPAVIRAEYVRGKINVIEFADFECPFCRKFYPVLKRVLADYPPATVHFERKQVPLDMHPGARPAARAAICAELQGKGEALADKLVELDLSPPSIHRAAVGAGVDVAAFDACLASAEPDRRIAADTKLLDDAGMDGLPTTYVGGVRLLGAVPEAALRDAFERAARGAAPSGVPAPVYLALLVGSLAGTAWLARSRRGIVKDGVRS